MPDVLCLYGLSLSAVIASSCLFVHHSSPLGAVVFPCSLLVFERSETGGEPQILASRWVGVMRARLNW